MNAFEQLAARAKARFDADYAVSIEEPVTAGGTCFLTLSRADGYVIEIEWRRHRGFGIAAGRELTFGSGVDEIYGSADAAFERIGQLVESGDSTSSEVALDLAGLRKSRGLLQKDVAERLRISKSGLAQMEQAKSLTSMQVETLRKLVASLGGELVLTAQFPDGHERVIAVD